MVQGTKKNAEGMEKMEKMEKKGAQVKEDPSKSSTGRSSPQIKKPESSSSRKSR